MAVCGMQADELIRKLVLFYRQNKISCGIKLDFKQVLEKYVK